MAVNLLTVTPKMVLLLTVPPIFDPAAILGTNIGAGMLEARYGRVVPVGSQMKQFLDQKLGPKFIKLICVERDLSAAFYSRPLTGKARPEQAYIQFVRPLLEPCRRQVRNGRTSRYRGSNRCPLTC